MGGRAAVPRRGELQCSCRNPRRAPARAPVNLPTGQPVTIDLPDLKAGELKFECGMGMVKGTIVVAPKK
ncbi:cupredoxin domain-containing protein [Sorangium sp. So ce854]|uniref:cupredoxin domain-containing protein n=1 Tax=Sorangium sp. So ce854 TaxID=3133322 RepID=UPI003F5D5780